MSLHHELSRIDTILRGKMNRRARLKRTVTKHANEIRSCTRKIEKAEEKLELLKDKTAEDIAMWTDKITLNEEYKTHSKALLDEAEHDVNVRLDDLGAI